MKRLSILMLILLLITTTSCTIFQKPAPAPSPTPQPTPKTYTIKDYYPFKENIRMKYQGVGNEYAEKDVYVDFIKGDRIQLRVINPGTTLGQVLEVKNGELRLITSREEFYYRDDLTAIQNPNPEILLKEPLQVGTTWTTKDGNKRYISNTNVKITTPSGEYNALEVTTEGKDFKTYDYYVINLGHVKTVFEGGGGKIETNLEKIENNATVNQAIKVFYPDFNNNRLVYKNYAVSLKTNDEIKNIFENYFKNPPNKNLSRVMSPNSKINSLYLDYKEQKVRIDLSKEFITEMNAGSALESMILNSLVNTLGSYYNINKVYISIDGKPYSSGHFAIKENEYFKVNLKNAVELK